MVYTKVLMSRSNTGPGPGPRFAGPGPEVRVQGPQKGAGPDLDRTLDSLMTVQNHSRTMQRPNINTIYLPIYLYTPFIFWVPPVPLACALSSKHLRVLLASTGESFARNLRVTLHSHQFVIEWLSECLWTVTTGINFILAVIEWRKTFTVHCNGCINATLSTVVK